MEHQNIFDNLRKNDEVFSVYLRENLVELFPIDSEVISRLQGQNYFQTAFYVVLYRTFLLFGWRITSLDIVKVSNSDPPLDLATHILVSLNKLKQVYFSTLFMLVLCQNIFCYNLKPKITWDTFLSYIETQNYIDQKSIGFIKYRWEITHTFSRKFMNENLPKIDTSSTPKWKKCIIEESLKSYSDLYQEMENYPEIQVAFPTLNWNEGDILTVIKNKNYTAFKKISITYKKEMYNFSQRDWWVDFANRNLGGGVLRSGFVQEEILGVKFPELIYFSSQGYKIPYKGAIVMTNLLKTINFPEEWYGRKNISTRSCWDIIAGIEKEAQIELKNFIAIAAVDHSRSKERPFTNYTSTELVTVFNRCYSGFMMAKILGAQQINSGPLGSGAYNNSPVFMYTLQILAASAVGIDITFWGTGPNHEISLQEALKIIDDKEEMSLIPSSVKFKGLINVGSSCYIDSVLFSLLYKDNPVVRQEILEKPVYGNILNVQQEMIKLKKSIKGESKVETCSNFRGILREIPEGIKFSGTQQHDAGEFLLFLMDLFKVQGATVTTTVYGTNDMDDNPPLTITSSYSDINASLVNFIDSFTLSEIPSNYMLSNFIIKRTDAYPDPPLVSEGKIYIRKITKEEVKYVPDFYAFYVQRADPITNLVLTKPIYPDESITFGSKHKKILHLFSVVIHVGGINSGHYLVYFRYGHRWWIYNDLSHKVHEIGTFEQMINRTPSPASRGVIYFYDRSLKEIKKS